MTKVAIKTIGIATVSASNAPTPRSNPLTLEYFSSFNQADASISEKGENDATGIAFTQELNFIVRREEDIAIAKKYQRRAVEIQVRTVDGKQYTIGSQQDPVYMDTNNQYDGTKVREMQISVKTQSLFPMF